MDFKIHEDFSTDLQEKWTELYREKPGPFNSSYEWCGKWFEYFGENKQLCIITGCKDDKIRVLAPFYRVKNRIFALGGDLYDIFTVLFRDTEDLEALVRFIFTSNLEITLNYILSNSDFFKSLLRANEQEKIYNIRVGGFTSNPIVYKNDDLKSRLNSVNKRLKRKEKIAKRDFNEEIEYEFRTIKDEKHFNEFVDLHLKSWNTFKNPLTRNFIKDLYLNCDFTILSRLSFKKSKETLAYDFSYLGQDRVLYPNLRTYNTNFSTVSPGLFIMYYCHSLPEILENYRYIDLGRGAMDYKYFFTDTENVILNLRADLSWKRYKKIYYPLKTFKERIQKYGI